MVVSLRLPADLKQRVTKLVQGRAQSPHAFMLEAIRERLEAEEAQAAFLATATERLKHMKESGKGIGADEVFSYLHAKTRGEKAKRPKARKLP